MGRVVHTSEARVNHTRNNAQGKKTLKIGIDISQETGEHDNNIHTYINKLTLCGTDTLSEKDKKKKKKKACSFYV